MVRLTFLITLFTFIDCTGNNRQTPISSVGDTAVTLPGKGVIYGAMQLDLLIPQIRSKHIALVVNHTAVVGKTHLADTLRSYGISIKRIFAPEHGFRGAAADGEHVKDGVDTRTGLPVASLYGSHRKPTTEQLADVDIVIFDIQDVGTRFYTYISTLHYVMEACMENGKKLIILDRPNPNAYVDGPVLEPAFKSFVGMHPIPVVHGLTVGELARMINGEGWLPDGKPCDLEIIKIKNWRHDDDYSLAIKPSPNLPNDQAVKLYPSLCFFEGTVISVGRGTDIPFQILGNPILKGPEYSFTFTPVTIPGTANKPLHEHKVCNGQDLRTAAVGKKINLQYLIKLYRDYPDKANFFTNPFDKNYFNKLAGTDVLKQQIIDGLSEEEIRASWKPALDAYQEKRNRYLLYP